MCCALAAVASACASFGESASSFSAAPSLSATIATVQPDSAAAVGSAVPTEPTSASSEQSPGQSADAMTDPCAIPALPVVAVCLDEPWGLAALPGGDSALVGERVSGRILSVTIGQEPTEVATIADIDASRGGGVLGIALSPYFVEDQLIYVYVTTSTDARILRFAEGQEPKAIVTGLPRGGTPGPGSAHGPGGSMVFGPDGLLYVVIGAPAAALSASPTAGAPTSPAAPAPTDSADGLTGAVVLRFDTSGEPAATNSSGTALFADGFTQPTGLCAVPDGDIGVIDHRSTGDVLIAARDGRTYTDLASADTVWTYSAGDGGALDCTISDGALLATARTKPKITWLEMRPAGGFTGVPETLFDDEFGLLRTLTTGPGELVWTITSNRPAPPASPSADDRGADLPEPDASDDRLLVLPAGGGGGGGGID